MSWNSAEFCFKRTPQVIPTTSARSPLSASGGLTRTQMLLMKGTAGSNDQQAGHEGRKQESGGVLSFLLSSLPPVEPFQNRKRWKETKKDKPPLPFTPLRLKVAPLLAPNTQKKCQLLVKDVRESPLTLRTRKWMVCRRLVSWSLSSVQLSGEREDKVAAANHP